MGLAGTQLAGAVIGLRGGWGTSYGSLSYDLFVGTPVYKPAAFNTARITTGFQLVYQY
ncbi:ShlB/FhaC/HecB family hemolysin secretion/activation protein [Ralstonia solanacearum]|nr:ShlB/FhaC/HecB family hemolysin secretion/activation protein [Ralstonia solanacearum]NKA91510.1 ShlB/FhaC/HecB family hemolysin secretion/activation protein [Ralstonia solanacearum]NKA96634.1 ShlB/FhaC/HecB family hemolysin secretion/activation protein [Ralstonia solanacearum]NKF92935.1 ShlB/FhaC/HecB family hemolysin secretion/activation protein [Ralstonia solanacearum]NKG13538.1 ShlB/FhaC/HecB family hemolysin secretion/activation protein [Ralstonia solanacearum]